MTIDSQTTKKQIPQKLLETNTPIDPSYHAQVIKEIEIERQWYKNVSGFKSYAEMLEALEKGILAKVTVNENYLPILRFRNPKLEEKYPPFLTIAAKQLLNEIGQLWRKEMNKANFNSEIKFAITSLTRTLDYQKTLIKAGKLADPESVHTRGEAFDIDASAYYLGEVPINPRKDKQMKYMEAFDELGAALNSPSFGNYHEYDTRPLKILKSVLETMAKENKLHFVHEFPNTGNDVYHVSRNPLQVDKSV